MNNRNLALKVSKHPLIELLKKDTTIPNSIVARLIAEELNAQQKKDVETQKAVIDREVKDSGDDYPGIDKAKKLIADLPETYTPEMKAALEAHLQQRIKEKEGGSAEADPKADPEAGKDQKKEKPPEDIKDLIVVTLSEGIADYVVGKFMTPILNKINAFFTALSAGGGIVGMAIKAAVGYIAQKGTEELVKKAIKEFVKGILESFKTLESLDNYMDIIFGKKLEKQIANPDLKNDQRKQIIKNNAFIIFKNILRGGVKGQLGDTVKEKMIGILGLEVGIGQFKYPIGETITSILLGEQEAQAIDAANQKLKALDGQIEKLKAQGEILDKKMAELKQLLDDDALKAFYEIAKDVTPEEYGELVGTLNESPSDDLKTAQKSLKKRNYQDAVEKLVSALSRYKELLSTKNPEDLNQYKQHVKKFIEAYDLGLRLIAAIEKKQADLESQAQELEDTDVSVELPPEEKSQKELTSEPKSTAQPTSEPEVSEPATGPESQEAGEKKKSVPKKASTEIKGKPVAIKPNKTEQFVNNANCRRCH